jgi:hypothetical protein
MALLKVYLLNGSHVDVEVAKDAKASAEKILETGIWGFERGEAILYPPSQVFRVRVVKSKPAPKPAKESK